MRHRKSCAASSDDGTLNDVARQVCGFNPVITCRTVPSLPAASMPCRIINKARRLSAYSRYSSSAMRAMFFSNRSFALSPLSKSAVSSGSKSSSRTLVCGGTRKRLAIFISVAFLAASPPFHVTDDFLDDVFDRQNADVFAFGADDNADGMTARAQDGQHAIDALRRPHEQRLLHELSRRHVGATGVFKQDFVHVDDPDDLLAVPHGEAGKTRLLRQHEEFRHEDVARDRDRAGHWQHDVVNRLVGKI